MWLIPFSMTKVLKLGSKKPLSVHKRVLQKKYKSYQTYFNSKKYDLQGTYKKSIYTLHLSRELLSLLLSLTGTTVSFWFLIFIGKSRSRNNSGFNWKCFCNIIISGRKKIFCTKNITVR